MYQKHEYMIYRTTDSAWIPTDINNVDYQEYLAWIAEGNTPEVIND